MPLCRAPANPYLQDTDQLSDNPSHSSLIQPDKHRKLLELVDNVKDYLQTQLNPQHYKSTRPIVTLSIKEPTQEHIQAAFYAAAKCAHTIYNYLELKDKLVCAFLQIVDGVTSSTQFDQNSFSSAQKFENPEITNSLSFVKIISDVMLRMNAAVVQAYPANDIASYKRLASQIMSDQGKRFSQECQTMAQDSNKAPLRRLKEADVQYDITGMFPIIQSCGMYYNFQSDDSFAPTIYRLSDPHVLQQRISFLVAAGECLLLKYKEATAAAVCMSMGHKFQCEIEMERLRAQGLLAAKEVKILPGILSKNMQYNLVDFFTNLRQKAEFEIVRDSLGPSARLPDVRQKEAKLLL